MLHRNIYGLFILIHLIEFNCILFFHLDLWKYMENNMQIPKHYASWACQAFYFKAMGIAFIHLADAFITFYQYPNPWFCLLLLPNSVKWAAGMGNWSSVCCYKSLHGFGLIFHRMLAHGCECLPSFRHESIREVRGRWRQVIGLWL